MDNKVVNSGLSEQGFINIKLVGRVAAVKRRLVLQVSMIEMLGAILCS